MRGVDNNGETAVHHMMLVVQGTELFSREAEAGRCNWRWRRLPCRRGKSLGAIHDWTFLFGPSLAIGVNTLLLAYLMFASRLVPRVIPVIGLIGGPLLFASGTLEMYGLYGPFSVWGSLGALPVFAWEMSLAVWMMSTDSSRLQSLWATRSPRLELPPL